MFFRPCVLSGDRAGGQILEASHGICDGRVQEMASLLQEKVCSRQPGHAGRHRGECTVKQ